MKPLKLVVLVWLLAATLCRADVAVGFAHDISVRIVLKTRPKIYRQQLPIPKAQPLPEYPIKMREESVSGEATVRFTVRDDGTIENLRVVKYSQKEFANASVVGVRTWIFNPGLDVDGKKRISSELEYLILFELHEN